MKIAERFRWAMDRLNPQPDEHILEIGCGHGIAVSLLCEKRSRITALDRSQTMIDSAKKRNEGCPVTFMTAALHTADFGAARFDKIFAINVNVFWMKPARELRVIHDLLKPGGALFLFYQPPHESPEVTESLERNLQAHGFEVVETFTEALPSGWMTGIKGVLQPSARP